MSSFDIWLDNYKINFSGKSSDMNKKGMEAAHHDGFSRAYNLQEQEITKMRMENQELKDVLIDIQESVSSVRATIES